MGVMRRRSKPRGGGHRPPDVELFRVVGEVGQQMLTGRLVRFDDLRGYGFIAPDKGGEDVFVHANDFGADRALVQPGIPVEFEASEGDRGLKVLTVRIVNRAMEHAEPHPARIARAVNGAVPLNGAANGAATNGATGTATNGAVHEQSDDDALCDVLTPSAMRQELTEVLLSAEPTLTAAQIVQLRSSLVEYGQRHGWVET
jgi:CspA family cold shock protein